MTVAVEADVRELLRDILAELRGLRADFAAKIGTIVPVLPARESLSRADLELLGRLLPAIGGALGSEQFTSRDLAAHSAPGLRLVLRGLSVKQIGRLLARADGIAIDGWVVERCGIEINVALWRVVASVSIDKDAVSHRLESGTGLGRSGAIKAGAPNA
jgi:hypothetical protein